MAVGGVIFLSQFTYVLPIHVAAVFITLFFVVIADLHALSWLIGKSETLPAWRMDKLHQVVSLGLLVVVTSGIVMFWPVRDFLIYEQAFQVKALFVLALIVNSFFIQKHLGVATNKRFSDLSWKARRALLLSGAVSTTCWVGAFVSAQFIGL